MKVAKVFVNKYNKGKLLGFCDIIFALNEGGNGCLTIRGFKIFKDDNGNGIQVATPSKKEDNGQYYPLVKLDFDNQDAKDFMNHIKDEVTKAYNGAGDSAKKHQSNNSSDAGSGIGEGDIPF